jgi:tetratricopeptide (TPR) repeat protein
MSRQPLAFLLLWLVSTVMPAFGRPQPRQAEGVEPASIFSAPEIDAGFRELYELRFSKARELFADWQEKHPEDPLGDVSIAAGYLFEEFYRQGVLSSEFFLNDKRLLGGIEGKPDRDLAMKFKDANRRAREIALQRLKSDSQDVDALYSLTLATGMKADYLGILERRHLESLRLIKEAESYAKRLLRLRPDAQDAWLALGVADYIIGSLPAPKRFFLMFGGIHGNKKAGMDELRRTAENGHYLKPYAKMLLGLVALREMQDEVAREEFTDLAAEFPGNPLFASELERLNHRSRALGNVWQARRGVLCNFFVEAASHEGQRKCHRGLCDRFR